MYQYLHATEHRHFQIKNGLHNLGVSHVYSTLKKSHHDLIHVFISQKHLFEQILFTDALLNLPSTWVEIRKTKFDWT